MPAKVYVQSPPFGDFRAMPALGGGFALLKWITSFPGNPAHGLPTVNGVVCLSDAYTGVPLALLDAPAVTALRTGAVAAVASLALARQDARSVGIIGCGLNGAWVARCMAAAGYGPGVCFDPRAEAARGARGRARLETGDRAAALRVRHRLLRHAGRRDRRRRRRPAPRPAPQHARRRRLAARPRRASRRCSACELYCDEWEQASHGGELAGAVAAGLVTREQVTLARRGARRRGDGRSGADAITMFDSTGLAIQDLAVSIAAVQAARDGAVQAGTLRAVAQRPVAGYARLPICVAPMRTELMAALAGLLPGIRDLRAPLAAGYIWRSACGSPPRAPSRARTRPTACWARCTASAASSRRSGGCRRVVRRLRRRVGSTSIFAPPSSGSRRLRLASRRSGARPVQPAGTRRAERARSGRPIGELDDLLSMSGTGVDELLDEAASPRRRATRATPRSTPAVAHALAGGRCAPVFRAAAVEDFESEPQATDRARRDARPRHDRDDAPARTAARELCSAVDRLRARDRSPAAPSTGRRTNVRRPPSWWRRWAGPVVRRDRRWSCVSCSAILDAARLERRVERRGCSTCSRDERVQLAAAGAACASARSRSDRARRPTTLSRR